METHPTVATDRFQGSSGRSLAPSGDGSGSRARRASSLTGRHGPVLWQGLCVMVAGISHRWNRRGKVGTLVGNRKPNQGCPIRT